MTDDSNASFGELLRHARWNANLTQEGLAERAGVSVRAISDLERGINRSPRRDTLAMLSEALDLSEDERAAWESSRRRLAIRAGRSDVSSTVRMVRGNLPSPLTSFVGRSDDIERIASLVRQGDARLISLTGPGGVGKTRLGITCAHMLQQHFPDGTWFVDLAQIRDPDLVIVTILATIEVGDMADRLPLQALTDMLGTRRTLLILDNVEHVIQAAPRIAEVVRTCPNVVIIATTRMPLRVQGEHEFLLAPLAIPELPKGLALDEAMESAAIALFVDRARAVRPDFSLTADNVQAVAGICRHLDGIPLAIELASGHIRALPPQAILERLEHPLPFLTGGSVDLPARQRTLFSTLAWSYDLLPPDTQELFRELGVFRRGWTLESIAALTGLEDAVLLDMTEQLVALSLVQVDDRAQADPRFSMLDTVREFALTLVAEHGDVRSLGMRHAGVMLRLAEQARAAADSPAHGFWLDRLDVERANLNAALEFSVEHASTIALQLATQLYGFWYIRGPMREGGLWLERALEADTGDDPALSALALYQCGEFARTRGDFDTAEALGRKSLAISRDLNDEAGIALALFLLGNAASSAMQFDSAIEHFTESLRIYRSLDNKERIAFVLNNLAQVYARQGQVDLAQPRFEEALATWQSTGSTWGMMITYVGLGELARARQDYPQAREYYMQSLQLFHDLDDRWGMCECLFDLAETVLLQGDPELAVCLFSVASELKEELGIVSSSDQVLRQQQVLESARQALDAETFWRSWAECRQMEIPAVLDLLV